MAYSTIADYYQQQGKPLPAYNSQERLDLAKQAGISSGYVGSADQNNQIVAYLNKQQSTPSVSFASSTPSAPPPSSGMIGGFQGGGLSNLGSSTQTASPPPQSGSYPGLSGNVPAGINFGNPNNPNNSNALNLGQQATQPAPKPQTNTLSPSQSSGIAGGNPNPGAYTYSGGVNANGQTFPGYTPPNPQTQTAAPFPGYVGALGTIASQQSPEYQQALKDYNDSANQMEALKQDYATQNANITGGRTDLAEAGGQQGLLQNLFANKQQAIIQRMQAAAGVLGYATGQQNVQQQGLNEAAGLTYPIPGNALGFYNPGTGQYSPYGGGQGGGLGQAGMALGTLGLAQQFPQLNASYQQATQVKNGFEQWIQSNPGVIPSDANAINELNQWARGGQFSDPKYPELNQFLNEYLNTITPLIGAGGNITNFKQGIVQQMINPTSSANSIIQQIENLHGIAGSKLTSMYNSFSQPFNPSQLPQQGGSQGGNTFGSFY